MLHISNKSYVVRAVAAWGFHLVLCARNRVLCLCTPERKAKMREESGKAERYWGRRIKKAKQPLLIEYNCVYERLRAAQRGRKLLGHESRWLDLHDNLVHSLSGTVTGALEQWHHHLKCHRGLKWQHTVIRASKNMSSVQNQISLLATF